jgi:hypothetical protein
MSATEITETVQNQAETLQKEVERVSRLLHEVETERDMHKRLNQQISAEYEAERQKMQNQYVELLNTTIAAHNIAVQDMQTQIIALQQKEIEVNSLLSIERNQFETARNEQQQQLDLWAAKENQQTVRQNNLQIDFNNLLAEKMTNSQEILRMESVVKDNLETNIFLQNEVVKLKSLLTLCEEREKSFQKSVEKETLELHQRISDLQQNCDNLTMSRDGLQITIQQSQADLQQQLEQLLMSTATKDAEIMRLQKELMDSNSNWKVQVQDLTEKAQILEVSFANKLRTEIEHEVCRNKALTVEWECRLENLSIELMSWKQSVEKCGQDLIRLQEQNTSKDVELSQALQREKTLKDQLLLDQDDAGKAKLKRDKEDTRDRERDIEREKAFLQSQALLEETQQERLRISIEYDRLSAHNQTLEGLVSGLEDELSRIAEALAMEKERVVQMSTRIDIEKQSQDVELQSLRQALQSALQREKEAQMSAEEKLIEQKRMNQEKNKAKTEVEKERERRIAMAENDYSLLNSEELIFMVTQYKVLFAKMNTDRDDDDKRMREVAVEIAESNMRRATLEWQLQEKIGEITTLTVSSF